jgi:hypothetical protein
VNTWSSELSNQHGGQKRKNFNSSNNLDIRFTKDKKNQKGGKSRTEDYFSESTSIEEGLCE